MPSIRLLVLAPTTLFALGCVPQSQYDSLLMANNTLEENQAVVEAERDEALARIDDAERRANPLNLRSGPALGPGEWKAQGLPEEEEDDRVAAPLRVGAAGDP